MLGRGRVSLRKLAHTIECAGLRVDPWPIPPLRVSRTGPAPLSPGEVLEAVAQQDRVWALTGHVHKSHPLNIAEWVTCRTLWEVHS